MVMGRYSPGRQYKCNECEDTGIFKTYTKEYPCGHCREEDRAEVEAKEVGIGANLMAKTAEHSELPWKGLDHKNGLYTIHSPETGRVAEMVCQCSADLKKANAEFIVRAVNNHDKLVEALRNLTKIINVGVPVRVWYDIEQEYTQAIEAIKEAE